MKCRNCGQPVRRIEPGEGYDLREYEWTHESGGLLCGMDPPMAEPEHVYPGNCFHVESSAIQISPAAGGEPGSSHPMGLS